MDPSMEFWHSTLITASYLLAGDTKDGVHVVVTHVSPASGQVLGVKGKGELLVGYNAKS